MESNVHGTNACRNQTYRKKHHEKNSKEQKPMIHSPLRSNSHSCDIEKLVTRAVASSQRHRVGLGRDALLIGVGRDPASRSDLALCQGDVRRRTPRTVNHPFLIPAYEVESEICKNTIQARTDCYRSMVLHLGLRGQSCYSLQSCEIVVSGSIRNKG